MRDVTIVLDDDPTGSQEASGVEVLLEPTGADLVRVLTRGDAVYALTNTRALGPAEAVALLTRLRTDIAAVEAELDVRALVVQRGDSTLRGHVFAEIDVFARPGDVVVLVPAFPRGGRVTVDGVHLVRIDGAYVNAADSEFARDPVFGYTARTMVGYVREKGSRDASSVPASAVGDAAPGTTIVPDVRNDADLLEVADGVRRLITEGRGVVVRTAASLAAILAGVRSSGLVALEPARGPVLLVVGSHTAATTRQVDAVLANDPGLVEIDTALALRDPSAAAAQASTALRRRLDDGPVAVLATERQRRPEHGTVEHAAAVMAALTGAVAAVADLPAVVIAKGGITSAEVARSGLGARSGRVLGQIEAGVSLWELDASRGRIRYVVVPGNMGDAATLARMVSLLVHR